MNHCHVQAVKWIKSDPNTTAINSAGSSSMNHMDKSGIFSDTCSKWLEFDSFDMEYGNFLSATECYFADSTHEVNNSLRVRVISTRVGCSIEIDWVEFNIP